MRGRKLHFHSVRFTNHAIKAIKKESPNEGTETAFSRSPMRAIVGIIKKESPNEGTETCSGLSFRPGKVLIKKESPNEGTETACNHGTFHPVIIYNKKRIPE